MERTPADRVPSHGIDELGMRYAYDFIRTDERRGLHPHPAGTFRWFLIGGRTQDCYGWGQPIHAAFGGQVVQVVDGVPERRWLHPLRETWAALRNAIAFARTRHRLDPVRLAGNHVIVGSGAVYALYAHLAPGSISVAEGEAVTAGQVIGFVGHSGNSTAPHLHFHLMDRADPLTAKGIQCAFSAYLAKSRGTWVPINHGIPERLQRIRSVL